MFCDYENGPGDDFRSRMFSMGRHHGGPGFGAFASGFASAFGQGGGPFRMGRKFTSADLQIVILALLADKPRHGYELIKELEERSGGFYTPSPGMIYPALAYLEEVGYATAEAEGAKKLYHITDPGRAYLEKHRDVVDRILRELERIGEKMDRVRRVFTGEDLFGSEEDEASYSRGFRDIQEARHRLKAALHQKRRCSPEEAGRIAEILRRATEEILSRK